MNIKTTRSWIIINKNRHNAKTFEICVCSSIIMLLKFFAIYFIYPHWVISIYLVKFYFDFVHIIGYWLDWFSLHMRLFSMLWYKFGLLYQIRHIVIVFYDMLIKKKNETLNFSLYLKINHHRYKQLQSI